jgi:copper chaperone
MAKVYKVLGMTCGGCASSVTKAIQAASPEAVVDVDLEANEVNVEGPGGIIDDATIKQAVEGAGFEYAGPA